MDTKWREANVQTFKVVLWRVQGEQIKHYLGDLAPLDNKQRKDFSLSIIELPQGSFVLLRLKAVELSSITTASGSFILPILLVMSCCEIRMQHSFKVILPRSIREHCVGEMVFCRPRYFKALNAAMTIVCWDSSAAGFGLDGCSNCMLLGGTVRIEEEHYEIPLSPECPQLMAESDSICLLACGQNSEVLRSWRFSSGGPLPKAILNVFRKCTV